MVLVLLHSHLTYSSSVSNKLADTVFDIHHGYRNGTSRRLLSRGGDSYWANVDSQSVSRLGRNSKETLQSLEQMSRAEKIRERSETPHLNASDMLLPPASPCTSILLKPRLQSRILTLRLQCGSVSNLSSWIMEKRSASNQDLGSVGLHLRHCRHSLRNQAALATLDRHLGSRGYLRQYSRKCFKHSSPRRSGFVVSHRLKPICSRSWEGESERVLVQNDADLSTN